MLLGMSYSLLLAEDSEDDFHLIKTVFEMYELPFVISHVENGQQAWKYLCGEDAYSDRTRFPFPRLLLTDLKMPVWDGFELIQRVRAKRQFDRLPMVLMSGCHQHDDRIRALELGANSYVIKDLLLHSPHDIAAACVQLVESYSPVHRPAKTEEQIRVSSNL